MVEIKSLFKYASSLFVALFLCGQFLTVRGGVEPRFEGLHSDTTYMALLHRVAVLIEYEEELMDELADCRDDIAEDSEDLELAKEIEELELELFDVQRERGEVQGMIQGVEQRWELQSFDVGVEGGVRSSNENREEILIEEEDVKWISRSRVVGALLSRDDMDALVDADESESVVAKLQGDYVVAYREMREMQQRYMQTESEQEALEIMGEFRILNENSLSLLSRLGNEWSYIYDTKIYSYGLMLEMLGREDILRRVEESLRDGAASVASLGDDRAREVGVYGYQKRVLLRYEMLVGNELKLVEAVDSLRVVLRGLEAGGEVEELDDVDIEERNFIVYEDVKFSTKAIYSKAKPIPFAKVYGRGTVYRLQVGAYKYEQLPTIFRGAYPLSYDKTFDFWTYYVGAFETMVEAQRAVELCKSKGFKRPEIVVWHDGQRRNLYRQPLPKTKGYRVQIDGVESIPADVERLMESMCAGAELSRVGGDKYILGTIEQRAMAEEFIEAAATLCDELVLTVVPIE